MLAVRGAGAALRRGRLPVAGAGAGAVQPGPPPGPAAPLPLSVDLRSDTVTRPSAGMRRAMARAAVGDDDYGEDPAVNELQRLAAGILGMEEALFVPTVTMANLIAVMCHCQRRGGQLLLGRDAHLHLYEHGGAAQVAGVHSQALPDLPDGTFDLDQLELTIREAHGSRYHLRPELICLENTHSSAGGRVLPLTYLQQVRGLADCYGLRVHMDGARLMNAAVAQDMEPAHITQHCDSVSLCFSKGLGAPAGAVLAGRREFVDEAWRARKLLGGGMRQAGVLAAAARVGLGHMEATLRRDHNNARRFAEGIQELNSPLCSINLKAVETNIVMVSIRGDWPSPAELCEQLRAVSEEEVAETGQAVSVLLFPWSARTVRAVWHRDVSARDTELAKNKLEFVARKCQEKLARGLWPTSPSAGGA
ncbi:probable low-specificity L-threonine aldolase 2 isoform X2 [Falco naumanni]|uniref:probable low-specificity L-threonine aldolase 2 isoform X2 n=1 Tax=Falco naumanni TaxID=148594 RepID=UPI001ADE4646|nr:probable low-specificity L-threonine aldolase 2 isoform X2 [Falco naumanni]